MANNKVAVVILAIIALAAAGFSGYVFTTDLLSKNEVVDYGNIKSVAYWDTLSKNIVNNPSHSSDDDFLVAFSNPFLLDTSYVNIINETRFTLPKTGLYKITLNVLWNGLDDGEPYYIILLRNNSNYQYFDYFETRTPTVSPYKYTFSSVFVNSTGGDEYYEINAYSYLAFGIYPSTMYNYISIDYIIQ
jgi:hypothetical protein